MPASHAFGDALRGWRARVSPAEVGLPVYGARRTTGLRRDELAGLAGTSTEYVIQLEQGRAANPSPQVVAALARALRLAPDEQDHLFRCAGLLPPGERLPLDVGPDAERLVEHLADRPVLVLAADWTVLGWNDMWVAVAGDPAAYGWPYDNMIASGYLDNGGRSIEETGPWPVRSPEGPEATEAALVADLRAAAARYPADERLTTMIERMRAASARFAELWSTGTVLAHGGRSKVIEHPVVGDIHLDCEVLMVPGADLKLLTMMAPAGSAAEKQLAALRRGRPGGPGVLLRP